MNLTTHPYPRGTSVRCPHYQAASASRNASSSGSSIELAALAPGVAARADVVGVREYAAVISSCREA